jgi:hypothetical protein
MHRVAWRRYQKLLASCSPVRLIDLNDVNRSVPLPPPPPHAPPAFVLGGEDDKVVDTEAIRELATAYRVAPVILPGMAHDVMLVRAQGVGGPCAPAFALAAAPGVGAHAQQRAAAVPRRCRTRGGSRRRRRWRSGWQPRSRHNPMQHQEALVRAKFSAAVAGLAA